MSVYLDLEIFSNELESYIASKPKDCVHDLDEFGTDVPAFIKDLEKASSTAELAKYDTEVFEKSLQLLFDSTLFFDFLKTLLKDESLLADQAELEKQILLRRAKVIRLL